MRFFTLTPWLKSFLWLCGYHGWIVAMKWSYYLYRTLVFSVFALIIMIWCLWTVKLNIEVDWHSRDAWSVGSVLLQKYWIISQTSPQVIFQPAVIFKLFCLRLWIKINICFNSICSARMMWHGPNVKRNKPEARRHTLIVKNSPDNFYMRQQGIICLANHEIGTHYVSFYINHPIHDMTQSPAN